MKTGRKYGEKEKMQILIKSLIFRTLQIYIFSFYAFLFFVSLADAENTIYTKLCFVAGYRTDCADNGYWNYHSFLSFRNFNRT